MVLGLVLIPSAAPGLDLVPVRCARSITGSKLKCSFSFTPSHVCFSIQPVLVVFFGNSIDTDIISSALVVEIFQFFSVFM